MMGGIYVPIKCQVALGKNVPNSFTNRIVGFILGETHAQSSSTHLCRETPVPPTLRVVLHTCVERHLCQLTTFQLRLGG